MLHSYVRRAGRGEWGRMGRRLRWGKVKGRSRGGRNGVLEETSV